MLKSYQGMDLEIPYPDSWMVSEEKQNDWVDAVTLESPESSFLSINRYPKSDAPEEILDQACKAMSAEYEEVEQEDLAFDIGDSDSFGCDLRFYCLDLLVVSRLLAFRLGRHSYLVQMQAEDREFERLRPVFHAMLTKALQSLDPDVSLEELPR